MLAGRSVGFSIGSFVLKAVVILCLMAAGIIFSNREWLPRYWAQFKTPDGQTANGMWVGMIYAYTPLGEELPTKTAAIQFKMHLSDAFMNQYRGTGTMVLHGDTVPRVFQTVDISITKGMIDGDSAGITEVQDFFDFHGFKGTFRPGEIEITTMDFSGYKYRGTLHPGTLEDYTKLCQKLNATGATQ